ncbi:hypothetical protein R0595_002469 [Pluralibacter gergoviae]|nr:hypothetical protein [Pluralibacter gergoviae]ELW9443382.1 hypothetical protein [Pluralibacter gergoviae]
MVENESERTCLRGRGNTSSAILLFLLFISMVINDLPIQYLLGTLAASPMWLLASFVFLIAWISNGGVLYLDKYSKSFLYFFIFSFTISLLQCIWFYTTSNTILNTFATSVIAKHIFASSYYFIYFIAIYSANYVLRFLNINYFTNIIILVSVSLIVIFIVEYIAPGTFSFLHLSMEGYGVGMRQRLLSPEPSIAAFTFNSFILLAIAFCRTKFSIIVFWFFLLIGNFMIGSKSALLLILVGAFLVFYFNMNLKQKLKYLTALIPIVIVIYYFTITVVLPALISDIENFTSVSTRLITSLWAICSLLYFPFGEGYGTYTVYFTAPLDSAISVAQMLMPFKLNLSEINQMISTGDYLSAKSGILFSIIQTGFLSIALFFILFKNAINDIHFCNITYYQKTILRILTWYTLLSILLAVNIEVLYTFLLPFIAINYLKEKNKAITQ